MPTSRVDAETQPTLNFPYPSSLAMLMPSSPSPPSSLAPPPLSSFIHFPTKNRTRFRFKTESKYSGSNGVIDEVAYEAERLRLDAKARRSMAEQFERSVEAETDPKAWKWMIRKRVWDLMGALNVAQNPRPIHRRIPNFFGAPAAANKMAELDVFKQAECVKVNPDTSQKQVRLLTLTGEKKLLTPQPRLGTGFFSVLDISTIPSNAVNEACTFVGVAKYGRPIGLDERLKVDLIVIGSVVVDPRTGARLGKGEGFAEIEYGMLRHTGAIDDSVLVVTSVHNRQLVDDIPVEKLLVHDVSVDIICTPTQVIFTNTSIPKPPPPPPPTTSPSFLLLSLFIYSSPPSPSCKGKNQSLSSGVQFASLINSIEGFIYVQ